MIAVISGRLPAWQIIRTTDYPHGRSPAPVDFSQKGERKISRLPALVDNPKTKENRAKKFENSNVKL